MGAITAIELATRMQAIGLIGLLTLLDALEWVQVITPLGLRGETFHSNPNTSNGVIPATPERRP